MIHTKVPSQEASTEGIIKDRVCLRKDLSIVNWYWIFFVPHICSRIDNVDKVEFSIDNVY